MKVIKRDGSTVSFDRNKIVTAISKANKAVEGKERLRQEDIEEIASFVEHKNKKETAGGRHPGHGGKTDHDPGAL